MTVLRETRRYTPDQWEFMEGLAEERRKQGLPPPVAIQKRATVTDEHADLWRAFCELATSRARGWDACPITPADVSAWCDLHGVADWRRPMFWRVIHSLDLESLREARKA